MRFHYVDDRTRSEITRNSLSFRNELGNSPVLDIIQSRFKLPSSSTYKCEGVMRRSRGSVLWHAVFISFHENTSLTARRKIYDLCQGLAERCGGKEAGILFWKVDWNLDLRKGVHLVEIAAFRDGGALQTFREHPEHKKLTDILRKAADWQVSDINGPKGA